MFFHLDQVNQMHFRDQHLELSDSPTNEVAYNYFKFIEFLWFSRFFTSYFPLWSHHREIMISFYRPLFHRSLIHLPSPLQININLMPNPLYFKGNIHFLSKHVNGKCLKCLYPFFVGLWGSFLPILERDHQHVLIVYHSTTCPPPISKCHYCRMHGRIFIDSLRTNTAK